MSGGHFDYNQYRFNDVASEIERVIKEWEEKKEVGRDETWREDKLKWGYLTPETIEEFRRGVDVIKRASIYTQRIDWLLSGDDDIESFHERLKEELDDFKTNGERL